METYSEWIPLSLSLDICIPPSETFCGFCCEKQMNFRPFVVSSKECITGEEKWNVSLRDEKQTLRIALAGGAVGEMSFFVRMQAETETNSTRAFVNRINGQYTK